MSSTTQHETKHESKHCPRCRREFQCRAGSILLCQCRTVILTPEQMDFLSALYADCLCAACLADLRSDYNCRQHQRRIQRLRR